MHFHCDKVLEKTQSAEAGRLSRKRSLSHEGEEERKKKRKLSSGDHPGVDLKAKYMMLDQLGRGGCGSVFAGYRKADLFPVAIKRIPQEKLYCKEVGLNGKKLPREVAIMLKLTQINGSMGTSAPVSLLDWYDLGHELVVVMERPVPSMDLYSYRKLQQGPLEEKMAKEIMKQLVDAAIGLERNRVFHRDIKCANILIKTGSGVPQVRLIDFGLSCFVKKGSVYNVFFGTVRYAPPEYFRYSVYRAGPSTVWQLGTVLYEMVHNEGFKTKRFLRNEVRIKSSLCKDLKDFLRLCLKGDPKLRPSLTELQLHPWLN